MLTLEYNGTEKSLADWGFALQGCTLTLGNQHDDPLRLYLPKQNCFDAPLIPFEGRIKLRSNRVFASGSYSGGVLEYSGKRVIESVIGQPREEAQSYVCNGPWYDLSRTLYQQKTAQKISGAV